MLYDPKWEIEVKADPFTLDNLIGWLEKQNPQTSYCFTEAGECLLAKWAISVDPTATRNRLDNSYGYIVNGAPVNLGNFHKIANGGYDFDTFGAALERARAAVQS